MRLAGSAGATRSPTAFEPGPDVGPPDRADTCRGSDELGQRQREPPGHRTHGHTREARDGARPATGQTPVADRVKGTTGTLTRPVEYRDGLRVEIVRATSGVVTDVGPGALTGAPYRLFTVRFRNDTARPIDLSQVVLAAYYGKDQQAQPGSTSATSRTSRAPWPPAAPWSAGTRPIPTGEKGPVTLTVDFDSLHAVAVFRNTGPA